MRFCFSTSKMLPPCGKNVKSDIFVAATPISKILFLLFFVCIYQSHISQSTIFLKMGYNLLILT